MGWSCYPAVALVRTHVRCSQLLRLGVFDRDGDSQRKCGVDRTRTEEQTLSIKEPTMSISNVTGPKRGDRVNSNQHNGIFEVVAVNALMQAANIRAVDGSGPVIPNVPWTALKPANK
jgi:hypothetical protein